MSSWQCAYCGLFNNLQRIQCQACFEINLQSQPISDKPELDETISELLVNGYIRCIQKLIKNKIIVVSLFDLCCQYYHINKIFDTKILQSDEQHDLRFLFEIN